MIGQEYVRNLVETQINNGTFPRFSILVGQRGSGKKLLGNYIAKLLNASVYMCGTAVSEIRDAINQSYRIGERILYVIPDADTLSLAAKNALLKVTEEPPRNAYFLMTLQDQNNTLDTIRSRGTVFFMDNYTPKEIEQFCFESFPWKFEEEEMRIITDLCETPLEVLELHSCGVQSFFDYVTLVTENIDKVSGSNSFKIASKIAFKEEDEGKYSLRLFWKAFMTVCARQLLQNPVKYSSGVQITSKYLQELRITGINKVSTFDQWILDIRSSWMSIEVE